MHLDEAGSSIEVQVQVLDLANVAKSIVQVILGRLLVQVGNEDDPTLDGYRRRGVEGGGTTESVNASKLSSARRRRSAR
eukprot:scaffold212291_cov29-Tisochrysis_lutea.AAC.1